MGRSTKSVFAVFLALLLCIGAFSGCAKNGGGSGNAADNTQPGSNAAPAGNNAANTVPENNAVPAKNTVTAEWRRGLKITYTLPEGFKGSADLTPAEKEQYYGYEEAVCAYIYESAEQHLMVYHNKSERDLEGLTMEQKIALTEQMSFLVTGETVDVKREKLENDNGCEVWKCTYMYEFKDDSQGTEPGNTGSLSFTDYWYFVRSEDLYSTFGVLKSSPEYLEQHSEAITELFKSLSIDGSGLQFSYDPHNDNSDETPFFYGLMDEADRAVYTEIEAAMDVQKFKDGRDLEYIHESADDEEHGRYWRIFECVSYEHPENVFSPSEWGSQGRRIHVLFRHTADKYNDGSVEKRLGWLRQIEETSDRIIKEMPQNLTRYGKYMYLARTLGGIVEYDYSDTDGTVVSEDPGYPSSLVGVYIYGKAVCEGYAQAYAYLCKRAGLFCTELIAGEHAWNLIRLNGELYYFDLTWMDSGELNWYHPNSYDDLDQDHKDYLENIRFRNSDWQPSIDAAKKTGRISWPAEQ